jgi:mRNA interferase RelE/StbE
VYELNIKRAAEKDIDQISPSMARRVMDAATKLKREPRLRGTKKLTEDIYRVRVGDYRLIYHIDDEARSVTLLRVKHRREAYR